jgi:uncharacterized membrane-anchored protein
MNRRLAFLLAVVAQLAFLGWMVAAQERVLAVGRRIVLPIEPVDPIDPLSGRHLAIRPKLSRIDLAKLRSWADAESLERAATELAGHEVIVPLREEAGEWVATEVEDADSFRPGGELALRGRVRNHYGATVVVEFGLERYFIPSDASDPSPLLWEPGHTLAIAVRVMADGSSTIEDLLVDGQPFRQWNAAQKPK